MSSGDQIMQQIMDVYAEIRAPKKYRQMNAAATDILACASDPDFREEDASVYVFDDPHMPFSGFCFAMYRGERVGPYRFWPARLSDGGDVIR